MDVGVHCPGCGASLRAPNSPVHEIARCPFCNTVFRPVGPAAARAGNANVYSRPCLRCGNLIPFNAGACSHCGFNLHAPQPQVAPQTQRPAARPWRVLHAGLTCVYAGSIGILLCITIGASLIGALAMRGHPLTETPITTVEAIAIALAAGCGLNVVVGQLLCIAAPAETGGKGFAIAAACCVTVNIAIRALMPSMNANDMNVMLAVGIFGGLLNTAQTFLFVLFLKELASYLLADALADAAGKYLLYNVYLFGGQFLCGAIVGFTVAAPGAMPCLLLPLAALAIVVFAVGTILAQILFAVWFIRLVQAARFLVRSTA
jgi:hypothetical protein